MKTHYRTSFQSGNFIFNFHKIIYDKHYPFPSKYKPINLHEITHCSILFSLLEGSVSLFYLHMPYRVSRPYISNVITRDCILCCSFRPYVLSSTTKAVTAFRTTSAHHSPSVTAKYDRPSPTSLMSGYSQLNYITCGYSHTTELRYESFYGTPDTELHVTEQRALVM